MDQLALPKLNRISQSSVEAQVKPNRGFKPLATKKLNKNLNQLKSYPERIEYLRQSLKEYIIIKKNIFLNRRKKVPTEDDIYQCDCISSLHARKEQWENPDISIDCGEGCLNRQMSSECETNTCPCGITCQNRRFQLHQDAGVYPKPTYGKGFGLIAGEFIRKGQFILQYIGEVLSLNSEEGVRRINEYSNSTCTYMMKLNSTEVIDPTYKGNMARFINHSCDPNCETQKWNVLGETKVGIFAVKDIHEGQELSFNYQFDVYQTPFTRCLCGTPKCKGYLGLVPLGYTAEEWNERVDTMPCEICGSNDEEEDDKFLICDNCNNGFHTFCLDPPITSIPKGAWFCDRCKAKKAAQMAGQEGEDDQDIRLRSVIMRTKSIRSSTSKMVPQVPLTNQNMNEITPFRIQKSKEQVLPTSPLPIKEKPIPKSAPPARPNFDVDSLHNYEDIYNLQKQLQKEIISSLANTDELKAVAEAATAEIYEYDPEENDQGSQGLKGPDRTTIRRKRSVHKVLNLQKSLSSIDPSSAAKGGTFKNKPAKISRCEQIKRQINKIFQNICKERGVFEKLKDPATTEKLNSEPARVRRMMSVSTIELMLFQESVFRNTKRIDVKLFWSRDFNKRDFFSKSMEFRISSNDQQYDWFKMIFELMEQATFQYKTVNNFGQARVAIPAIFLKRVLGEYQKNVHHIQSTFQVSVLYDKAYYTDDCFPMDVSCNITLKGIKDNIVRAVGYLQDIIDDLQVRRIYKSSADIRIIILNLMSIKQKIHPCEIRCNRDNALRDINHPFYTIYYPEKEVCIIGSEEGIRKSKLVLAEELEKAKKPKESIFSLNYLVPVCEKQLLVDIKQRIENNFENTKLIIYNPTFPRKNISLTLSSDYTNYPSAFKELKEGVDRLKVFDESFEQAQRSGLYKLIKNSLKLLHNYFQTKSTIFMKSWDTITPKFLTPDLTKSDIFEDLKHQYVRDHDLKFYLLSVTKICRDSGYRNILLSKRNIVTICKSMVNRLIYYNKNLHSRNYQSIFPLKQSDFINFLEYYNPKNYFQDYSGERLADFEKELAKKVALNDPHYRSPNYKRSKSSSSHSSLYRGEANRPRRSRSNDRYKSSQNTGVRAIVRKRPESPKNKLVPGRLKRELSPLKRVTKRSNSSQDRRPRYKTPVKEKERYFSSRRSRSPSTPRREREKDRVSSSRPRHRRERRSSSRYRSHRRKRRYSSSRSMSSSSRRRSPYYRRRSRYRDKESRSRSPRRYSRSFYSPSYSRSSRRSRRSGRRDHPVGYKRRSYHRVLPKRSRSIDKKSKPRLEKAIVEENKQRVSEKRLPTVIARHQTTSKLGSSNIHGTSNLERAPPRRVSKTTAQAAQISEKIQQEIINRELRNSMSQTFEADKKPDKKTTQKSGGQTQPVVTESKSKSIAPKKETPALEFKDRENVRGQSSSLSSTSSKSSSGPWPADGDNQAAVSLESGEKGRFTGDLPPRKNYRSGDGKTERGRTVYKKRMNRNLDDDESSSETLLKSKINVLFDAGESSRSRSRSVSRGVGTKRSYYYSSYKRSQRYARGRDRTPSRERDRDKRYGRRRLPRRGSRPRNLDRTRRSRTRSRSRSRSRSRTRRYRRSRRRSRSHDSRRSSYQS